MSTEEVKFYIDTRLKNINECLNAAKNNTFNSRHQEVYDESVKEIIGTFYHNERKYKASLEAKTKKIEEYQNPITYVKWAVFGLSILIALLAGGCPYYNVWEQEMSGKAELSRASQNRQIEVQKAKAASEAATMYAEAEIARAKGVSESNEIIKDGLGGPEGYLRYLYIEGLKDSACEIIYVPTEAGLPILEAGKRHE